MSLLWLIVLGLAMGVVFGAALEKSRVMEPGVLVGQFQFRNFTMLKMFLAATITGLVALAVLNGVFGVALHPKAFAVGPVLIGGLILGVGIALAGACPGTALAQAGAGYRDAWAIIAGGIGGAIFYGYAKGPIDAALGWGDFGKITFADVFAVPFWALALIFAAVLAAFLVVLERFVPSKDDLAQAETMLGDPACSDGGARPAPAE
ncbi:YeeE/YedE thiosulfate transporter family protein [Stappia stellulata]|uniref:YeeE/YedE thiosulfate transporter family protein n=1 Tax=Stappia stellulata TaxID=71235 RepID=UPI0004027013|nr:YeeE/YedE thiosulfate transporter family protein [Stappia stellulata]